MIHVLYPEKPGGTKTLVGGAHLDSSLHAHEAGNLTERYIPTAEKPAGNTTYRRYAQLKWKGSGPAPPIGDPRTPTPLPPGAPGYPGLNITPAQAGLWDVAPDPKTTFDNPADFLAEAQSAWQSYLAGTPSTAGNFKWNAASKGGVHVEGWATHDPGTGSYTVDSVYPDGAWVK
jgi:hypothetical protein